MDPGDVIIILQLQEHDTFTRRGSDLIMKKSISMTEALCGFCLVFKQLDGRDIVVKHPPGHVIAPGQSLAVLELIVLLQMFI